MKNFLFRNVLVAFIMTLWVGTLFGSDTLADWLAVGDPNDNWTSEKPYRGYGFEWENNMLGVDQKVPAPWTPVKLDGQNVLVWGRKFTFDKGFLPVQIVSQNQNLLFAPSRILMRVNGEVIPEIDTKLTHFKEDREDRVILKAQLDTQSIVLAVENVIEFDGFMLFSMTIKPKKECQLDELFIEIPFARETSRYYSGDYDYDFVKMEKSGRGEVHTTAGVIDKTIAKGFNHHLWIGGSSAGMEISSETNFYWSNANPMRAIEIIPGADKTVLRLRIVDTAIPIDKPISYKFGFYVTPTKPKPVNWRTFLISNYVNSVPDGYDKDKWTFMSFRPGPYGYILQTEHSGLPLPPLDPKIKQELYDGPRKAIEDAGALFIPYGALFGMHANVPEFRKYYKRWLRDHNDPGRSVHKPWADRLKEPLAPDKPGADFRISLYSKSIQDFLVWTHVRAAREFKHAGLYFDIATPGTSEVNPLLAQPGKLDEVKLFRNIFADRKFFQRLYKATKTINPNFMINLHTQKLPVFYGAYIDVTYPGEAMNAYFRQLGYTLKQQGKLPDDCPPYVPDYSYYSIDFMAGAYSQNLGFVNYFLPQVEKDNAEWLKKHPEEKIRYTRMMLARTLLLDIPCVYNRIYYQTYDTLMLGFQKYFGGLVDPIEFIDPWDEAKIRQGTGARTFKLSAYVRKNKNIAVLIISNLSNRKVTEGIVLDPKLLAIEQINTVVNIETDKRLDVYDNCFKIEIPANDFAAIMIK